MNFKKIALCSFLLATIGLTAKAQVSPDQVAFQAGEELVYAANYKVGFIEPDLAQVHFKVTGSSVDNVPCYRVSAVAEVDSKWKWFFDMRDEYNTWLDKTTLRPVYFKNTIKEGSYRSVSEYFYDWDKKMVNTHFKNLKHNNPRQYNVPLLDDSFDGVALFYHMRNDVAFNPKIKPGYVGYVNILMKDTVKRLQFRFVGYEERNISGLGKYRTKKFTCQLTTDTDHDAFPDGSEFFVWFSDDRNCIPLYLETPIRVGSVKCYLAGYRNLKYPLEGKVGK